MQLQQGGNWGVGKGSGGWEWTYTVLQREGLAWLCVGNESERVHWTTTDWTCVGRGADVGEKQR